MIEPDEKPPLMRFKNWSSIFEDAYSRKLRSVTWMRENIDLSDPLLVRILEHENGAAIFGITVLLRKVAATGWPRGDLRRANGKPHTAITLAQVLDQDLALIQDSIDHLVAIDALILVPAKSPGIKVSTSQTHSNDVRTLIDQPSHLPLPLPVPIPSPSTSPEPAPSTAATTSSSLNGAHIHPANGDDDAARTYVVRLRKRWEQLAMACGRWTNANEDLAREQYGKGTSIEVMEDAIVWGCWMHFKAMVNNGTSDKVASLRYHINALDDDQFRATSREQLAHIENRLKREALAQHGPLSPAKEGAA